MKHYIYIYLNPLKSGNWSYKNFTFDYQPFYVGMGVGSRDKHHLTESSLNKNDNLLKNRTIRKILSQNVKPIILRLYENISIDNAKLIEDHIIFHFGRILVDGGILTNIAISSITPVNSMGKKNIHSKIVYEYNLNGQFKKKWDCGLREIGRTINKSYNNIADCCRGKSKRAYGSMWFYEYMGDNIESYTKYNNNCKFKKTYSFNKNNEMVREFNSLKDASIYYNIEPSYLKKCILHNNFYMKKFYFSFNPKFIVTNKNYWTYKNINYYKRSELQKINQLNDYQYKKLTKEGTIKKW